MPTYNVHLYREIRLFFPGIEADTPEQAAKLTAQKLTDEATTIDDCEGESVAALVDLVGDEDFSESVTIDLDLEKAVAPELLAALDNAMWHLERLGFDTEEPLYRNGKKLIAKARGETLPEAA